MSDWGIARFAIVPLCGLVAIVSYSEGNLLLAVVAAAVALLAAMGGKK